MNIIVRILLNAIIVFVLAYILPGVTTDSFWSAIIVAVVLALLNIVVKPILVILTIPITIVTLGLFLLVINACIILMASYLIDGFAVSNFWWALLFSLLLSLFNSAFTGRSESRTNRN